LRYARFVSSGSIIHGWEEGDELVGPGGMRYSKQNVCWLPPVSPSKIVGLALNYADHAEELKLHPSEEPILFLKPPSSLVGNGGAIISPRGAKFLHHEGEVAVVIGKPARNVKASRAMEFVRGFTIANDITLRDFITNTFRPPVKAKGFDTFCPLGPFIVSKDEVSDVGNLEITTRVNGEAKQQGNTKNLLHSIPELIEFITSFMTLEVDDVILTGTPRGISPIHPGDRVEVFIDYLGTLSNPIIEEPETEPR
jgi:5-oxopent-3-ene-1,2,5-tricarboxylate decarboxylase / 2-hydroxyhepta-2,4-diene-1,7-dioate isomerase